jgi:hypothetical protein
MKNNCDVSGVETSCNDTHKDCAYFDRESSRFPWACQHSKVGRCTCVAAIRAAIEEENVREARLQALGFEPVSDEQRAENNAVHGLQHDLEVGK